MPGGEKPFISVVVIGLNVVSSLADCLRSIQKCHYPLEKLEIIYVDGGSTDGSLEIASQFHFVTIVELTKQPPTPGLGRNAGWRVAQYDLVQFLDGDTILERDWLDYAYPYLKDDVVAVTGKRRELYPQKNVFHMITEIEWSIQPGFCKAFGGDVLIKKKALQTLKGYDDELVAGEDPELSYRLRHAGGRILALDLPMTRHDIQMSLFSYLRRSVRSGYGYAEVAWRYRGADEKLWMRELLRMTLGVIFPWALLLGGMALGYPVTGFVLGIGLAFRGIRKVNYYRRHFNISLGQALAYTLHLAFVVYPKAFGVLKFFWYSLRQRYRKVRCVSQH